MTDYFYKYNENEDHNLRLIMDEIFGEINFIEILYGIKEYLKMIKV